MLNGLAAIIAPATKSNRMKTPNPLQRAAFAALTILALAAPSTKGDIIWRDQFAQNGGGISQFFDSVELVWGNESSYYHLSPLIFEGLILTQEDSGMTFEATSANDPGFDSLATLLTDGNVSGGMGWGVAMQTHDPVPVFTRNEPLHFGDVGFNGVDLERYQIDRFLLTIDSISF